jgi:hypothetical protein
VANHVPLNARIIGANEHESHYVFDLLYNNTTDIQPSIHSTDTHGTNEVNFAILAFFGYQFAPRYKDIRGKMGIAVRLQAPKPVRQGVFVHKRNRWIWTQPRTLKSTPRPLLQLGQRFERKAQGASFICVAISDIGVRTQRMRPDIATALVRCGDVVCAPVSDARRCAGEKECRSFKVYRQIRW